MSTKSLKNISLSKFRSYLLFIGCTKRRITGGHEVWSKKGLTRPVIIQTHKDPVPESVISNNLKTLGKSREDFLQYLMSN